MVGKVMRVVFGAALVLFVFAGCSLFTSEADVIVIHPSGLRDYVVVDGSGKFIENFGSATWTIEWEGLDDYDVDIIVYDTSDPTDGYWARQSVTLSNLDSKTFTYSKTAKSF